MPWIHGEAHRAAAVTGQKGLPEALPTLASLLKAAGYRTYGVTTNAHLAARLGFGRGFDRYVDLGFASARRLRPALWPVLDEALAGQGPYFLWVHIFDPHAPYRPNRRYLSRALPEGAPRFENLARIGKPGALEEEVTSEPQLAYLRALYDGEVRRADRFVAELLARVGDDAAIVVTADHGEEFGDHGGFGHGTTLYDELLHVPLIVAARGGTTTHVVEEPVSLLDVLPTLLDFAGVEPPASLDGRSLAAALRGTPPPARTLYASLSRGKELFGVFDGDWALIEKVGGDPAPMLFSRRIDPAERRDRSADRPEVVTRLRGLGRDARRAMRSEAESPTHLPLDDETRAQLRALGYVQ